MLKKVSALAANLNLLGGSPVPGLVLLAALAVVIPPLLADYWVFLVTAGLLTTITAMGLAIIVGWVGEVTLAGAGRDINHTVSQVCLMAEHRRCEASTSLETAKTKLGDGVSVRLHQAETGLEHAVESLGVRSRSLVENWRTKARRDLKPLWERGLLQYCDDPGNRCRCA